MELALLQRPVPRELSLFDLSGGSLEDSTCKSVFDWTQSLPNMTSLFSGGIYQNRSEAIVEHHTSLKQWATVGSKQ